MRRAALSGQVAGHRAGRDSAGQSGQSGSHHSSRAGTGHQPHRNRPRLRHLGDATRPPTAQAPARQNARSNESRAQADPAEFCKIFDRSMNYLGLENVDLLSLHGINNRQLLDWSMKKNGCLATARRLQKEGRVRFVGFSTHATTDIILQTVQGGEFDYINLHWYFVNDLNWSA